MEQKVIANHCSAGKAQPAGTGTGSSETKHYRSVWRPPVQGIFRTTIEGLPREQRGTALRDEKSGVQKVDENP